MLSTEVQEHPFIDRPAEAAADAMMHAQIVFSRRFLARPDGLTTEDFESILEADSEGKCHMGAKNALLFIHVNHSELFKLALILHRDQSEKPLGSPWLDHAFFLLKDFEGRWFAGSPANHRMDDPKSPMTTLLRAATLPQICERVKAQDKGIWPEPDIIEHLIDKFYFQPEIVTSEKGNVFKFFGITATGNVRAATSGELPVKYESL